MERGWKGGHTDWYVHYFPKSLPNFKNEICSNSESHEQQGIGLEHMRWSDITTEFTTNNLCALYIIRQTWLPISHLHESWRILYGNSRKLCTNYRRQFPCGKNSWSLSSIIIFWRGVEVDQDRTRFCFIPLGVPISFIDPLSWNNVCNLQALYENWTSFFSWFVEFAISGSQFWYSDFSNLAFLGTIYVFNDQGINTPK